MALPPFVHLFFLLLNPNSPPLCRCLVVSLPLMAQLKCLPIGCPVSLDLHISMDQPLGMYYVTNFCIRFLINEHTHYKRNYKFGCFKLLRNCFDFVLFRDFGFDPLRLGEVPENLERYKESELIHCRWAMLAVVSL